MTGLLLRPASNVQRSGAHLAALLNHPYTTHTGEYVVQGGRSAGPASGHAPDTARDGAKAEQRWTDSLARIAVA